VVRDGKENCRSRPNLPVEGTVLNRLRNMIAQDFFRAGQVRNRPRHLQNPVVGPGAQIQIGHRILQQPFGRFVQFADLMPLMMSLVYMMRAHDESKNKAYRISQMWMRKRKRALEGVKMTSIAPGWLEFDTETKKFVPMPHRVKK